MARAKIENPASRQAAVSKRRSGLFKKAHELAVLCGAEVAMIVFSPDGKRYEYASTSVQQTLARLKKCKERGNPKALQPKPEKPEEELPKEAGVPQQKADELKSRKLLGKDLTQMSLHELFVLEEKLKEGLLLTKDKKLQLLRDEIKESKEQKQKVEDENKTLLRQVEELKGSVARPIYYPVPISIHLPAMERNRDFLPSTSFAAQLALTSGPETEGNLQDADKASLPSTSSAAQCNALQPAADKESLASTGFGFGAPLAIGNGMKLTHWLPHAVTGSQSGTCLS